MSRLTRTILVTAGMLGTIAAGGAFAQGSATPPTRNLPLTYAPNLQAASPSWNAAAEGRAPLAAQPTVRHLPYSIAPNLGAASRGTPLGPMGQPGPLDYNFGGAN